MMMIKTKKKLEDKSYNKHNFLCFRCVCVDGMEFNNNEENVSSCVQHTQQTHIINILALKVILCKYKINNEKCFLFPFFSLVAPNVIRKKLDK